MTTRPHVDWTRLAQWGEIRFGNSDTAREASSFFRVAEAVLDAMGCNAIPGSTYLALCEPPIIGMFLMLAYNRGSETEQWQWVVVGDVPGGCLPAEVAFNQYQSLNSYIADVRRVIEGKQAAALVCPGWAGPTCNAERVTLERRMAVLEAHMIAPARHLL